jgi:hypothetical protein
MLVHDLQTFLSKFTEGAKKGTQGNALSHAKIFVERNGFLEEIKKMEVHESNIINSRGPWSESYLEYLFNVQGITDHGA